MSARDPDLSTEQLQPGSMLGKYRLIKQIGQGGMGTVFEAEHLELGRHVAIKVLHGGSSQDPAHATRFQREAELVTRIGHPNIVAVYDFGQTSDGSLYYVMELLSGEPLRSRVKRGALPIAEVRNIFTPLLSAIAAAHAINVIHRDLKPDNVMLVPDLLGGPPQVKLLDFGIAKMRGAGGAMMTMGGAMLGTPAYMSPEQVRGASSVDHRADIYSVGVMIYEALTGQRPFQGSLVDLLTAKLYQEPARPSELITPEQRAQDVVDWQRLDRMVLRALATDPQHRYADCASLLQELTAAMPVKEQTAVETPRTGKATTARKLGIAGGIFVGVAAIGAAILATRSGPVEPAAPVAAQPLASKRAIPADADPGQRAAAIMGAARRGSPEDRRALLDAITAVRSRSQLGVVAVLLADEEPVVFRAAVQAALAVGRSGDAVLTDALALTAGRAAGAAAIEVAIARLQLGDAAARVMVAPATENETLAPDLRLRAAIALCKAGGDVTTLRKTLMATANTGGVRPDSYRSALLALVQKGDEGTVQRLSAALESGNANLRLEAAEVLARAGRSTGKEALVRHAEQRGAAGLAAAQVLAAIGDARAPALLLPRLKDGSPILRMKSAAALGELASAGGPCSARPLEPLLSDRDDGVALTAAVAWVTASSCGNAAPSLSAKAR